MLFKQKERLIILSLQMFNIEFIFDMEKPLPLLRIFGLSLEVQEFFIKYQIEIKTIALQDM